MSTKFGLLIDFNLLRARASINKKTGKPRPPSWKIDMTSYFISSWPRMTRQSRRWGQNRPWKIWRTESKKLLVGRTGVSVPDVITRSHGSHTAVWPVLLGRRVKSMGEGKLTPLTTPTPLKRQSRNIAHVITSTISPHKPHSVKIAPGVTSPHIAEVTTQFFKRLTLL